MVGILDHQVECEELEHQLLVCQNVVSPAPVLLALLINNELRVLLGDLGDCDDDFLGLSAILLGLVGEEQGGRSNVLITVNTMRPAGRPKTLT